jgi:PAS domain S-box-containing protein
MKNASDWRILLIDDEQDIRDVIALVLTEAGFQVETAADGILGINACQKFHPHVVITDIRMPRMDGIRVLEEIKAHYPDVEVIVATAFAEIGLAIKALQLDASDFITKPIDNEALMVAVLRARQRHQTRQQLKDYTQYLETGWSDTTQELMETYVYQSNLIESSMDGIVGCDASNKIVTFNRSMEQISGLTKTKVLRRMRMAQLFDSKTADRFRNALDGPGGGGPDRLLLYETHLKHYNGEDVPVQISATRLENKGKHSGMVCFVRDLRLLRRLEQEMTDQARILHQDKMVSLGRLAASVAHEINNPLSGILNYLRLMTRIMERGPINDTALIKFKRYLQTVTSETDRCAQIINNLLTFSRKSEDKPARVDINELMGRCVALSRHRLSLDRITLETHFSANRLTVNGDKNQLQQCIINLIFNAIDAMPDGGRIVLSTHCGENNRHIEIWVKDDGCGISPDDQARMFEPFFTTKEEGYGVGLGLSTTYGIIQRHGGKIHVESSPGKGTTFIIRLPIAADHNIKRENEKDHEGN